MTSRNSAQVASARQMVIRALEHRLTGQPMAPGSLVTTACEKPEFARAWLAHAIGSTASPEELALALALAAPRWPDELARLYAAWEQVPAPEEGSKVVSARMSRVLERFGLNEPDPDLLDLWTRIVGADPAPVQDAELPVQQHRLPVSQGFLSEIRDHAMPGLVPASVYGPEARDAKEKQVRDSDQALMPAPTMDWLVASLERLMARACGRDLSAAEPLVVLRYQTGQQYRWHRDYIQPGVPGVDRELAQFGQRVHTIIAYLNDGFGGGATEFRDWEITVQPAAGRCISFSSVDENGRLNPDSVHRGVPVTNGEKWIATQWSRSRPLWNRRGLVVSLA